MFMKKALGHLILAALLPSLIITSMPQVVRAQSAAAYAAAAALIVGAIYYDSHHRPYWRDSAGHIHYVSAGAASYYNSHHWQNTPQSQRTWRDAQGHTHHCC